ncbi:nitrogen fixation protein NifZ [Shewanella avicenniae]|uniref:Nitrogen fixation protein NifZ n=1 Tax=Shewanella avicenniae TaxID=2814294 RepID=A0ABX7QT70_9GAMM|nr:nitrogen fixation protein NifZ [Shewanella avicenniae]QSX34180.1 nitrogen fixation protein NifZ [Shewanella avicenniae]
MEDGVRFAAGAEVRVVRNVRNDGTFYGVAKGELIVAEGDVGVVRKHGWFLQEQVIYEVFFPETGQLVGLRDVEVIDAALPFVPCRFRMLDYARLTLSLASQGELLARKGDRVQVTWIDRDLASGELSFTVKIANTEVQVPARALEDVPAEEEGSRWRRKSAAI